MAGTDRLSNKVPLVDIPRHHSFETNMPATDKIDDIVLGHNQDPSCDVLYLQSLPFVTYFRVSGC